jgi:3-hydroxyisobutyrate dehydrogenase
MAAPVNGPPTIALIGLGNMGCAIAERLLDAGYPLTVFNRTPGRDEGLIERGATRLAGAGRALVDADACLLSLADDRAVEAVAPLVLERAVGGKLLVDLSTISVAASRRIADAAAEAAVDYLRAPLSGNPGAVRSGKAAVIVSGPSEVAEQNEALLTSIAPTFRYVGEGERARVMKLVLQIFIGGTAELLAEGLLLGEAAGLERKTLLEVIGASVVGSPFIEYKTGPLLDDDYSATFTTSMMEKDAELVLELAREEGTELPFTRELRGLLEAASDAGHADEDFMSLLLLLQERAGKAQLVKGKG